MNRNGIISPLDALLVINWLNEQEDAEGESAADGPQVRADQSLAIAADRDTVPSADRGATSRQPAEIDWSGYVEPGWDGSPARLASGHSLRTNASNAKSKLGWQDDGQGTGRHPRGDCRRRGHNMASEVAVGEESRTLTGRSPRARRTPGAAGRREAAVSGGPPGACVHDVEAAGRFTGAQACLSR